MITQEMILAAKNAETNVAALIAVYPLIRNQVISECATVCESEKYTNANSLTKKRRDYNLGCDDCLDSIRSLKDKTDEAHNG